MSNQSDALDLSPAAEAPARSARARPLANRNFRLLWLGESFSLLGDQFYFIALPWLVFQMSSSALAFGTVLMVAGIPRALFMLVGGVMTDRFSPRAVMLVSNLLRLVITALLALAVAAQAIELWMLYLMAFCFGVVDAFFHPAYRAIVPLIVDEDNLQASNSILHGTSQLVSIVGPGVAGLLLRGVGVVLVLVFDAFTFLFTSIMLLLMHPKRAERDASPRHHGIWGEIAEMLAYVRQDQLLMTLILVVAAINLLFVGPLVVGSAALSKVRFPEGAAAYGAMLSTFSIGALIGTATAGVVRLKQPGLVSLLLVAAEGVFMVGVGFAPTLLLACVLWLPIGFGAGFGSINFITLTQKRVAKDMLGRFMSLIGLTEVGLTPISNALAGVVADWNVTALFVVAGVLLSCITLLAAANSTLRSGEA
jgi:predicted MFS family arabinose efflux permease